MAPHPRGIREGKGDTRRDQRHPGIREDAGAGRLNPQNRQEINSPGNGAFLVHGEVKGKPGCGGHPGKAKNLQKENREEYSQFSGSRQGAGRKFF